MKEKLLSTLGNFGLILYYAIRFFVSILPLIMIDTNFIFTLIFCVIMNIVPFASPIFWVWGLACATSGVQDWMAIAYYICFGVIFLPFIIDLARPLFSGSSSNEESSRSHATEESTENAAAEEAAKAARREALAQANDITDELMHIYKTHASKLSSKFKNLSEITYDNAKAAAPSLLFILSRVLLISSGILTQQPSKVSNQIDRTVYDLLSLANDREIFDGCLKYYQTFLPPCNSLPRCDVFLGDDTILSSFGDSALLRLSIAYGDCIVNPSLITDGLDAPYQPLSMFEVHGIASAITGEMPSVVEEFSDCLLCHFSKHRSFYQI